MDKLIVKDKSVSGKKLLTVQKASNKYGLDRSLLYHWIRYKKFSYFKIEKKILFWESDFISFLESHYINTNQE